MENKPAVCRYCNKSLNGQPCFHRHHETFCDVNCATLWDYADIFTIPATAIKPVDKPFEKEFV